MTHIVVCSLSKLPATARAHQAREMITLISNEHEVRRPPGILAERHLRLDMNDISANIEGLRPPEGHHVSRLIDFAREWDRSAPLLIHCWMGISRSTAAAYSVALALNPDLDAMQLALELRRRSPSATPNARLIQLADAALGRDGRMIEAIARIGRGAEAAEGKPFILPLEIRSDGF
ncbi:tyrosine phosphatase family protein [Hoeflea poritis]|uniref:Tyrosine phosphatase family protein n=1 Tax=Hoeflea poritis TaxID=2993659 RepID=A0ABT4VQC5_9HYPH|nr:tyrosine phosphatase family protein [Hoeflea poritis]MDA4846899.1 tyrosine phosphatase family protein [Hoeflea poritis]